MSPLLLIVPAYSYSLLTWTQQRFGSISDGSAVVLGTCLSVGLTSTSQVPSTHVRVWSARHDYDLSRVAYLHNVIPMLIQCPSPKEYSLEGLGKSTRVGKYVGEDSDNARLSQSAEAANAKPR